ncbi:MAG: vitamin B12 dependent-methionine synthase activation domain-containing protein, partial [Pseudomonadota bacterium]
AGTLLSDDRRDAFMVETTREYDAIRTKHAAGARAPRAPIAAARANAAPIDWSGFTPPQPIFLGLRTLDPFPVEQLIERIDWKPFFDVWQLAGRFPAILDDPVVGVEARRVYDDARAMLDQIVAEGWFAPKAVFGFFPARRDGADDIALFDPAGDARIATLHMLRQQMARSGRERPNLSLADFVAPGDGGPTDVVGGFCVTTGAEVEARVAAARAAEDDYTAIMVSALGDRLAEAFAERLHEEVRQTHWGFAADEDLSNEELIAERYRSIRPAPGYPACPDHTEKSTLFALLDCEARIGVQLTESYAMTPSSSVSGWYFAHPEARYFGVGRIGRDQVEDYAARKGWAVAEAERWLGPNLDYDPDAAPAAAAA